MKNAHEAVAAMASVQEEVLIDVQRNIAVTDGAKAHWLVLQSTELVLEILALTLK